MINYPVAKSLTVKNYKLYPGKTGEGFTKNFEFGINVILGINGLGKTTLLNILLRLLTGPADINYTSVQGKGQRKYVKTNTGYFAERVPDGAVNATASASFSMGDNLILIERKLSNLEIIRYEINGVPFGQINTDLRKDAKEEIFQSSICDFSGVESFYDFLTIIRFLTFYLEDRESSFWSKEAQFELLRILFYDPKVHKKYIELRNSLSSLDSRYRNFRATKLQVDEVLARMRKSAEPNTVSEIDKARQQHETLSDKLNEITSEFSSLETKRRKKISELDTLKYEANELEGILEANLEQYYTTFLPDLSCTAKLILTSIATGRGCLVCGSTNKERLLSVIHHAEGDHCPLCDSAPPDTDIHFSSGKTESFKEDFLLKEKKLHETKKLIIDNVQALKDLQSKHSQAHINILKTRDEIEILESVIRSLSQTTDKKEISQKEKEKADIEKAMDELKKQITKDSKEFRELLEHQNSTVLDLQERVCSEFKSIIGSFMAEDCELTFQGEDRSLGQMTDEKFYFPLFLIKISGGASAGAMTARSTPDQVSESQREFVELAFRMSLLALATSKQKAMLVLETPEASLDTYFMERAGNKLRELAEKNIEVIATSNLSKERLVPAMLGIPDIEEINLISELPKAKIPREERDNHILDLLDLAASTAALDKFGEKYRKRRQDSIWPAWELEE